MFPLLSEKWTAKEEQSLLFGIEHCGLGNWEDVATDFIKTKTGKEAEDHYTMYYVESSDMGRASIPSSIPNRMTDHTPPLHESLVSVKIPETSLPKSQQLSLAYMPQRDDFELEFDNDAETIVSGLTNSNDDNDLDVKLKVAQAQMYVTRLKERQNRKALSLEYLLVNSFFGKSFLPVKEDNDLLNNFKPCIRFMQREQMKRCLYDWQREKNLRAQVIRLCRYRKHGLKRMADTEIFDVLYKKRERLLTVEPKNIIAPLNNVIHKPEDARVRIRDIIVDEKYLTLGSNLLSSTEQKLCYGLNMNPLKFVTCKMLLFRDIINKKYSISNVKNRLHLFSDKSQRKKILSFLQSNGWINANAITAS